MNRVRRQRPTSYKETQEYEMKKILQKRIVFGQPYYLVLWKGKQQMTSWEPRQHLEGVINDVLVFEYNSKKQYQVQKLTREADKIREDIAKMQIIVQKRLEESKHTDKNEIAIAIFKENLRRKERQIEELFESFKKNEKKHKQNNSPEVNLGQPSSVAEVNPLQSQKSSSEPLYEPQEQSQNS